MKFPDHCSNTDLSGLLNKLLQVLVQSQGRQIDSFVREHEEHSLAVKQEPESVGYEEQPETGTSAAQERVQQQQQADFQQKPLFDAATKQAVPSIVRRAERRESRSSSEDPEEKNSKPKSPFKLEREHVPPILERYAEMEVRIQDW